MPRHPECEVDCWLVGAWLSLVERSVRDREAAGSNPVAPTIHLSVSAKIPHASSTAIEMALIEQSLSPSDVV